MPPSYVQVMLPRPFDTAFDYAVPEEMEIPIGSIVQVPFGNSTLWGMVWGDKPSTTAQTKIKPVKALSDIPPVNTSLIAFIEWVADYTLSPVGTVLAMTLSAPAALEPPKPEIGYKTGRLDTIKLTKQRQKVLDLLQDGRVRTIHDIMVETDISRGIVQAMIKADALEPVELPSTLSTNTDIHLPHSPISLSSEQENATNHLIQKVSSHQFSATLLDGITGSGKTEVYFEAIREALNHKKQALILLPEIVLTTQLMARFERSLGFKATQWHSGLTPKQRRENWRTIAKGEARLVIGARSALFLPYPELGAIIVDEEHETSFKQEDGVIYHGRDMAIARANIEQIPAILVSASPSLETLANVESGKFDVIHLHERHGDACLPDIHIVDMRQEKLDASHWISEPLKQALVDTLARGEQSMLYLNRRGYAPLTLCRTCGYRFQCPQCTAWLVEHRHPPHLPCHHCGYNLPRPKNCPECDKDTLAPCGPGVERLEEEVKACLPDARTLVMTSDRITSPEQANTMVKSIENKEIDIIIGTQMVAKGHHFPQLTLVGVVDADLGLEGGDLRAAEHAFQLLQQVSGRAGREGLQGRAFIQSYMPETVVMQALESGNREQFIAGELDRRKQAHMPPFGRLAGLILSGKDDHMVSKIATDLVKQAPHGKGVRVLGPAPAPLFLLRGQYRYRILVITERNIHIQKLIRSWLKHVSIPSAVKCKVDIDPYSFM